MMKDGPFPTHYEPFESPAVNLVAPWCQLDSPGSFFGPRRC